MKFLKLGERSLSGSRNRPDYFKNNHLPLRGLCPYAVYKAFVNAIVSLSKTCKAKVHYSKSHKYSLTYDPIGPSEHCYVSLTPMQPIYTLNARNHIMLEMLRDHFELAAPRMRQEILLLHGDVVRILASKGIQYSDLRSALVPSADRNEAAFIFDSTEIESSMYGREVLKQVLPLLEPRTTQSVLVGDLIGDDQELVFEILQESMILARPFTFRHSTLLYGVYINNLSNANLANLHERLAAFPAYLGHIPTSFASRAKTYLSLCMANLFIKKNKTLIFMPRRDVRLVLRLRY